MYYNLAKKCKFKIIFSCILVFIIIHHWNDVFSCVIFFYIFFRMVHAQFVVDLSYHLDRSNLHQFYHHFLHYLHYHNNIQTLQYLIYSVARCHLHHFKNIKHRVQVNNLIQHLLITVLFLVQFWSEIWHAIVDLLHLDQWCHQFDLHNLDHALALCVLDQIEIIKYMV